MKQSGGLFHSEQPKPAERAGAGRQIFGAKMQSPLAYFAGRNGKISILLKPGN
ncbi:MAG TPA: hypothetical protein VEA58_11215 [Anaerovoracaceae bacterium]|nr:hypothetical protein [Anaerovoracaceae bacterium]